MTTSKTRRNIYREITQRIIDAMEASAGLFTMPWRGASAPFKLSDGTPYRGINQLMLMIEQTRHGYSSGQWGTFNAWRAQGGSVRRGEKSTPIVFYKIIERQHRHDATRNESVPLLRHSNSFNRDQIDGLDPDHAETHPCIATSDNAAVQIARCLANAAGARVEHGGNRACYNPVDDYIQMPVLDAFDNTPIYSAAAGYAAVLCHELVHWSGHPTRLARLNLNEPTRKQAYAFEELIAELGASFLCAEHGVHYAGIESHADYIANWLKVLKDDDKAIFRAASQAEKATRFLSKSAEHDREGENNEEECAA